jgi:hypothetical protein
MGFVKSNFSARAGEDSGVNHAFVFFQQQFRRFAAFLEMAEDKFDMPRMPSIGKHPFGDRGKRIVLFDTPALSAAHGACPGKTRFVAAKLTKH